MDYETFIDHLTRHDNDPGLVTLDYNYETGHLSATVTEGASYTVTLTPDNYIAILEAGATEWNAEGSFNAWCNGMLYIHHFDHLMTEFSDHMAPAFAYYAAMYHGNETPNA